MLVPAALVVAGVVRAVVVDRACRTSDEGDGILARGIERQHQRPDFGPQEMVRARGAQCCERCQLPGADELEQRRVVVEVADLRRPPPEQAAQRRHQGGRDLASPRGLGGRPAFAAERGAGGGAIEPGDGTIDDLDGRLVGAALAVAPGEQAMLAEHDAARTGVVGDEAFQPQAELEAGAAPGQPADLAVPDGTGQRLARGRGGDRDHGIGMDVVDVGIGHQAVQRRVDAGGTRIIAESAVRIQADDGVPRPCPTGSGRAGTAADPSTRWRNRRAV